MGKYNDQHGNEIPINNQIDFIICKARHKHLIRNSQSYGGTLVTSDHKLVKTNFKITTQGIWKRKGSLEKKTSINVERLRNDPKSREHYKKVLEDNIVNCSRNESPDQQWNLLKETIRRSAEETIGTTKPQKHRNRTYNEEIAKLSTAQKELRIQISNSLNHHKAKELKKERNKILHTIKKKAIELKNGELDSLVEAIDTQASDGGMFKAVKLLNRKPFQNPSVEDETGQLVTRPNDILKITTDFFESKFYKSDFENIVPFEGEPRPLHCPISKDEVRKSVNRLNNSRAPGEDQIAGELLKYGPDNLIENISTVLNKIFERHEQIDINNGLMITLPKPGKPKGPPKNLRPITLLNTIRKSLSLIVLSRIRPKVENYISHSQSGFRPERSTADVVWTHRWIAAKINTTNLEVKITGIDMSAAFDTIKRDALLNILSDILEDDEIRIIRFLLSNTKINIKVDGATEKRSFTSNIGTPQGDSLSPVLFIIYLEHALREVRQTRNIPNDMIGKSPPPEVMYADDVDFIGFEHVDVNEVQDILKKHNLLVNTDKTEHTALTKNDSNWRFTKKVGSLIGNKEDIENRKHQSKIALNKLMSIWIRDDKIKLATKLKLYNSLVKSVLLYNCGTWALTKTEEQKIDGFHRKQLRTVLGIRYPVKISNTSLYTKCKERPISLQILDARWRLFGHILRRDPEIPANKAMSFYFENTIKRPRGRPVTTLPVTLNSDLKKTSLNLYLRSKEDLNNLSDIAHDRRMWKFIMSEIGRTAEAARSVDHSGERH